MKVFPIVAVLIFCTFNLSGQSKISGKVTDKDTGEELIYANVIFNYKERFAAGGMTDFDGNYSIPVNPGTYDLTVYYTGYTDYKISGIKISKNQNLPLNISMLKSHKHTCWSRKNTWETTLIQLDQLPNKEKISAQKIKNSPSKNINEIIQSIPGISLSNF